MKKVNILMIMLITSFVFIACEKEENKNTLSLSDLENISPVDFKGREIKHKKEVKIEKEVEGVNNKNDSDNNYYNNENFNKSEERDLFEGEEINISN